MPKIKSFAPAWLNEPAPGHKLFAPSADDGTATVPLAYGKKIKPGPRRTIARRGTEIFVACGKQIRWGDLAQLKESWESRPSRSSVGPTSTKKDSSDFDDGAATAGYRVSVACRTVGIIEHEADACQHTDNQDACGG